ncbi:hypothetical protein RCL1_004409 [Eukaryota sp. TZLM3-RCL]
MFVEHPQLLDQTTSYGKRLRLFKTLLSSVETCEPQNRPLLFASVVGTLTSLISLSEDPQKPSFEDYFRLNSALLLSKLLSSYGCGDLSSYVHLIIPPIAQRLTRIHSFREPVEEIRLALSQTLSDLFNAIQRHGDVAPSLLIPFVDILAPCFASLLHDPFSEVRIQASNLIVSYMMISSIHRINNSDMGPGYKDEDGFFEKHPLANHFELFYQSINVGVKLKGHQKSRAALIDCLCALIIAGGYEDVTLWKGIVMEAIKDQSSVVRSKIVDFACRLLLSIPNWREICPELLLSILIAIGDDIVTVRNDAFDALTSLGERYQRLYPNITKDRQLFVDELYYSRLKEINQNVEFNHPVVNCERFLPASSFVFVRSFVNPITELIASILTDWDLTSRDITFKGLNSLIVFGMELMIGQVSRLINPLVALLESDDMETVEKAQKSVKFLSKFSDLSLLTECLFTNVPKHAIQSRGVVAFLTCLIASASINFDYSQIVNQISNHFPFSFYAELSSNSLILVCAVNFLEILARKLSESTVEYTDLSCFQYLFQILIYLKSIDFSHPINQIIINCQRLLSGSKYHSKLAHNLIVSVVADPINLFLNTCLNLTILQELAEIDIQSFDDVFIDLSRPLVDRFSRDLSKLPVDEEENEGMLRCHVLSLFTTIFTKSSTIPVKFSTEISDIFTKILIPSMIWRRGKSFARSRLFSSKCTLALFENPNFDVKILTPVIDSFVLPFVNNLMSSEDVDTRVEAVKIATFLIDFLKDDVTNQSFIDISQSLLSLISDSKDFIRISAIKTLKKSLTLLFSNPSISLPKSNFQLKDEQDLISGGSSERRYRSLNMPIPVAYVSEFNSVLRELFIFSHDSNSIVSELLLEIIKDLYEINKDMFVETVRSSDFQQFFSQNFGSLNPILSDYLAL